MNDSCVSQLGKAAKRARQEDEEEAVFAADRLSDLPDFTIHHILSFLDAKCVVQTSVLSRVWRYMWKHVPALSFRRDSFRNRHSFVRFVHTFMDLRSELGVCKISFVDEKASGKPSYKDMLGRVMEYASSHATQHLDIVLNPDNKYLYTIGSTMSCNLETLELRNTIFPLPHHFGSSSVQMLTTLKLEGCYLKFGSREVFDLISNFPCLVNLVISDCIWSNVWYLCETVSTKIIGPQLLSLKLDMVGKTEIVAPRLESFHLKFAVPLCMDFRGFSKLSIPSLVHADILVLERYIYFIRHDKERMEYYLDRLLQGLHNAISLVIRSDDDQVLKQICNYVNRNRHLFTRLKSFVSKKLPNELGRLF
ncbi:F-box/LRR-repeat protein 13 [Linum grandiflorum]